MRQAGQLSEGDCYILDYLQKVEFSTDMVTYNSMGSALFHTAKSSGADCIIVCLGDPSPLTNPLKKNKWPDWQYLLSFDADIVLQA